MKRKNKTLKNKQKEKQKVKMDSCDNFCKNVYPDEIDKSYREFEEIFLKKYGYKPRTSYKPTKKDRKIRISTCKKNFCNKNCKKTYKYFSKEDEALFTKNMKDNFITNLRPKPIEFAKSNGAISYCDGNIYNPFNRK
jgi:hypothetical protein